jgi:site-specific DNA-methyltransferase (adenine-specific)
MAKAKPEATPESFAVVNKRIDELIPDAKNANKGTARGKEVIKASLKAYGAGRSILIDKNGRIIAGNKTAENAGAAGMQDVLIVQTDGKQLIAVQRMDLDLEADKTARELAIADNRASELSLNWDTDALKELDVDLATFWTPEEQARLAEVAPREPIPALKGDENDVPPAPEVPKTQLGDLYILGEHRLLCGDSTSAEDVARLMDGQKARCMWTDPPYGVEYKGGTKKKLEILNDTAEGLAALLTGAFASASTALEPGAAIYVAHPAGDLSITFGIAWREAGWRMHQTLVWDKGGMVLGHSDYHYAHEPIYYGVTPGAEKAEKTGKGGNYKDGHDPIFYGYTPGPGRNGRGGKGWFGNDSQRTILCYPKPPRNEEHPTMKPVGLVEHCLGNSTAAGHIVIDLFGGSGTTLIASQKMGRRARLMELSPVYCDVIVARWEAATGLKAERVVRAQTT